MPGVMPGIIFSHGRGFLTFTSNKKIVEKSFRKVVLRIKCIKEYY